MEYLDAMKIYEKYDSNGIAETEFNQRTAKDTGAVNLGLRLRIYSSFLDKKWIELRNKRAELVKNKGKCCDYKRIATQEEYSNDECSFINGYPKGICKPCKFYKEMIKPIDEGTQELLQAQKVLKDKAAYDDMYR